MQELRSVLAELNLPTRKITITPTIMMTCTMLMTMHTYTLNTIYALNVRASSPQIAQYKCNLNSASIVIIAPL